MGYLSYILYILPVFIFSLVAQTFVKISYKKYSKVKNSRNLSGSSAAQLVLNYYGISNVRISCCRGVLTDNFNPRDNTLYLSEDVYNGTSIASVGIACHEVGHAVQHAEEYKPAKLRSSLVGSVNFGSRYGLIIAFAGYFINIFLDFYQLGYYVIVFGLLLYSLTALFSFVTLPVEFNASKRAVTAIVSSGLLLDNELPGAKKVLISAAMTYIAAFATSVANVLYYASRLLGTNRRSR